MPASFTSKARRPALLVAATASAFLVTAAYGCSQPAPVIPQGAWHSSFTQQNQVDCLHATETKDVGDVSNDKRGALIQDAYEGPDPDGKDTTYEVFCSVVESGSEFIVEGSAYTTTGYSLTILAALPAGASSDNPATGTVSYRSPQTQDTYSSNNCNFYFASGTGQGAKPGQVWVTFNCPEFNAEGSTCVLDDSWAAFENCESTNE